MTETEENTDTTEKQELTIQKILANFEGNNICADCNKKDPDWGVSTNETYIFVCIKCSGVHRNLGTSISKVKSTKYDVYKPELLSFVYKQNGNKSCNNILEGGKPCYIIDQTITKNENVLKWFIQAKYQYKLFNINQYNNQLKLFKNKNKNNNDEIKNNNEDDIKIDNNNNFEINIDNNNVITNYFIKMPISVYLSTFLSETNKKKFHLQIFENNLYIFKNGSDPQSIENYNLNNIKIIINESEYNDNDNNDQNNNNTSVSLLQIKNIKLNNKIIYKFRSMLYQNITDLINFIHICNINKLYYNKFHYIKNNDILNNYKLLQNKYKSIETGFIEKNVNDYILLGYANKKAGTGGNWRKRYWLIYNNRLYYFKSNFVKENKYNNKDNKPQGSILLVNANIIWDKNKLRTNRANAFLVVTHDRTYYIQPDSKDCDPKIFFNKINNIILKHIKYTVIDYVKQQPLK